MVPMRKLSISDFIYTSDKVLSEDFCQKVIQNYENDERKYRGRIYSGEIDPYKNCEELHFSSLPDWEEIDRVFLKTHETIIKSYNSHCLSLCEDLFFYSSNWDYGDSGFQIQKYLPGEQYNWHQDFKVDSFSRVRMVTTIFYLNEVDEGGETEFIDGTVVTPSIGRVVCFPSTWTCLHRGKPPIKGVKYIVVTCTSGKPSWI